MRLSGVPVTYNRKFETLKCPGIEIKGLKTSAAPRKTQVWNFICFQCEAQTGD